MRVEELEGFGEPPLEGVGAFGGPHPGEVLVDGDVPGPSFIDFVHLVFEDVAVRLAVIKSEPIDVFVDHLMDHDIVEVFPIPVKAS